jgi:polysaccharide biosynthesis/export protein
MRRFILGSLLITLWCISAIVSTAQTRPSNAPQKRFDQPPSSGGSGGVHKTNEVIMLSEEDYLMAPKDVIEIVVEDAPELSKSFQINAAGAISMPFLGKLNVSGQTTEALAKSIADGLRGRYLKDPKVGVYVKQYNSRTFFIQGAVRAPGMYIIEGRPTLFRLLTIAGGLQDNHGSVAYIVREKKRNDLAQAATVPAANAPNLKASNPKAPHSEVKPVEDADSDTELLTAHITGLFKGEFDQNVVIEPGDVVSIPTLDVFYVAGDVGAPGVFPLKEGTTLRQAIALAQGTLFKAAANRAVIYREDAKTGVRKEIPVDVTAVMSGRSKEDLPIMPNDIVMVPNSRVKSISQALLQALGTNSMRVR